MKVCIYLVCLFGIGNCQIVSPSGTWLGVWKDVDDIDKYVERPCTLYDLNCIRRYFVSHSHCKQANGQVPDPFYITQTTIIPLAFPNITGVSYDAKVTGLNGRVTEFTINKKTGSLVFAVEMPNILVYSSKTSFRYHRVRREPIVLTDELFVNYGTVTLTAVFTNYNNLELSTMEVFSYLENSNPAYGFGPRFIKTFDMDAIRSFNALVSDIALSAKEVFITRGPLFMREFLRYSICNFGN